MIRLILVRHGETHWNKEGRFQGRIDVDLNEMGKKQAQNVTSALENVELAAIYSSPLKRSLVTAETIAKPHKLDVIEVSELNEIDHGLWEGLTIKEVKEEDAEGYDTWINHPEMATMPSGENLSDLRSRAISKLHEILEKHKGQDSIAIVAHDATNKVIICHALGLDNSHFWHIKQGNASIDVLQYDNGRFKVTLLNDTCHLGGVIDRTVTGAL